jgi:hypothetical protein
LFGVSPLHNPLAGQMNYPGRVDRTELPGKPEQLAQARMWTAGLEPSCQGGASVEAVAFVEKGPG